MKEELQKLLQTVLRQMGTSDVVPEVEVPEDPSHGEYTTNIAMKLAGVWKKPPMDIALQVVEEGKRQKAKGKSEEHDHNIKQKHQKTSVKESVFDILQDIEKVEVAPPGFINFFLTEAKLSSCISQVINEAERFGTMPKQKGRVMVEFAHPNTHKAFHIGHLRNITTGEAMVRLLEAGGREVIRANYQGDVGMHIAKCLWAMQNLPDFLPTRVAAKNVQEKVDFLGKAYAAGNKAYEDPSVDGKTAKKEIGEINKLIYAKDQKIYDLYRETRQWSLDYFSQIYKRVGSHFDRFYFESEVYASGKAAVLAGLTKGVFQESEGAIIFPGEKYGLHNRVFVTSEGNPTYEGKDMGLVGLQMAEYHPDLIIHIVGPEQASYFQVIFKAMELLFPETIGKQQHLIYGWVRLKHGKMSSRSGNVVLGEWLLDEAKKEVRKILEQSASEYNKEQQEEIAEKAAIAAVKYAFLKVSTKSEIAFDFKESVNLEGDSGPYLLYTYARAKSVLRKAGKTDHKVSKAIKLNSEEKAVVRLLGQFPERVAEASNGYAPNLLCTYLFNLAQSYNLFYAKHSILGADNSPEVSQFRLGLTAGVAQVLKNGLYLLGIDTLAQM